MSDELVIFGGTFNPIHHGHLIVAGAVAQMRGFERVTFMPVNLPPHGAANGQGRKSLTSGDTSAADRLEMIRLAISGEAHLDVSDLELKRPGASFTYDTLCQLRQLHPQARLHLIVGADMLADLPRWRRAAEVVEMAQILTVGRAGPEMADILRGIQGAFTPPQHARLASGLLTTPLIDISSSDIRRRVKAALSIRYLVPEAVRDFIYRKKLYI